MKISRKFEKVEREDIFRMAEQCLWEADGQLGRDYLINTRGLSEDVLRRFHIGYLPEDLDHQLHGRVIMPLFDASGNLVTITSRIIREPSDADVLPRYWHEAYEKSFYLYGMNVAKEFMRRWHFAVLVEGQIDAMRLHKFGLRNTVALCGTVLSCVQFATVLRYCDRVVFILDNDENETGQKAAQKIDRSISSFKNGLNKQKTWKPETYRMACGVPEEYKISYVQLEGAKDPDEYLSKFGYETLREQIKRALGMSK